MAMTCIDIFTKFATVVPIRSKKPDDYLAGFMECMNKMGKKPKFILSDDEGALNSNIIQTYLKEQGIKHIVTRTHAHYAERMIRTLKAMLYKRIDHDIKQGKTNVQWTDYLYATLLTYNNKKEHKTIEMTPAEARQDDNKIDVKIKMELKAKNQRKYPPLQVGDKVKIMIKYSKFRKERDPLFSDKKYEIEKIEEKGNSKFYTVNGKERLRNELMKVI